MNKMSPFWLKSEILFASFPCPAHTHTCTYVSVWGLKCLGGYTPIVNCGCFGEVGEEEGVSASYFTDFFLVTFIISEVSKGMSGTEGPSPAQLSGWPHRTAVFQFPEQAFLDL